VVEGKGVGGLMKRSRTLFEGLTSELTVKGLLVC